MLNREDSTGKAGLWKAPQRKVFTGVKLIKTRNLTMPLKRKTFQMLSLHEVIQMKRIRKTIRIRKTMILTMSSLTSKVWTSLSQKDRWARLKMLRRATMGSLAHSLTSIMGGGLMKNMISLLRLCGCTEKIGILFKNLLALELALKLGLMHKNISANSLRREN